MLQIRTDTEWMISPHIERIITEIDVIEIAVATGATRFDDQGL